MVFGIFKKRGAAVPSPPVQPRTVHAVPAPDEVLQFLRQRAELNDSTLMINVLNENESAKASSDLQSISAGRLLGLVVLDDANDSNPYCYITQGVASGMVVHFNHDPEPQIEFASLQAFEQFLRKLKLENRALGEIEVHSPAHPIQEDLAEALVELALQEDDEDAEFLICLYLPLLRGPQAGVLEALAEHRSFFVREALAEAIGSSQLPESSAVLERLLADVHPQVRSAADRARKKANEVRRHA